MLPQLKQLESSPELFRVLLDGLTEDEAIWKPAADRWSVGEVIAHLSHVEAHVFRYRLDRMLAETTPEFEPYDQEEAAAAGQYSGRDIEDSFDHWEEQRETNVEFLQSLPESILARQGKHAKLGLISVEHMLNAWAFHDLGHVRQVIELLRASRHYPGMGPFQPEYRIRP